MKSDLNEFVCSLKHKDSVKATTTRQFKMDLVEVMTESPFSGDILEIGTSDGYTTAALCAIGCRLSKRVYSFEYRADLVAKAIALCKGYGFDNFSIVRKDVYKEAWGESLESDIGCVFIDCVHTAACFSQDLENAKSVCRQDPIIIAHDYGLITKTGDGIKSFLDASADKYEIERYMGEKDNWNKLGSGQVVDWEGVKIRVRGIES